MQSLIHLAGGIALLLWGAYMVKTGMLRAFGVALRDFLSAHLKNRVVALVSGTTLASLLQSSTAGTLIIASIQAEGFLTTSMAFAAILGADFGSALMTRILTFDLSFLSPLMIFVGTCFFFIRRADTRQGQFGRILIGLGIIMLALSLIVSATQPVRTSTELAPIFQQISNSPILAIGLGLLLGFGCFSSLAAVIIASGLVTADVIPVSTGLWVALGADIESTILALLTTMTASRIGRRGPVANTIWRFSMLSLTGIVLATVPFVTNFFESIPDSVIYFHVALNLMFGILGLFFIKPLSAIAERIIPSEDVEDKKRKAGRELFAKENLISSGMSLKVAHSELQKIITDLRSFWVELDLLLRLNPAEGEILVMHDRANYLTQRSSTVTRYLNLVMHGQLTNEEAVEWQYLKNVNGSVKFAIKTIDRIITVTTTQKVRKNFAFTDEGLHELQLLHGRVLACIDQLNVILSEPDQEKRRALSDTLNEEREAILRESYDLTLRHMERVSKGMSGAIETSALHLELQSLFNRFCGLIGSAASIEYGIPNEPTSHD